MFAYVDETGNTGPNIFDEDQPDFYTAAFITRSNFDLVHSSALKAICKRHGIEAIHASVLGFGPIEKVAPEVLKLIKKVDARFFVSRVEKRYLVATKFFDTFFDSGENPAASWSAYNIRLLKLILCFKVATILSEDVAKEFWSMLMAKNEKQARAKIPGICNAVLEQVDGLRDQRSRDVVSDTLTWARDHPEALDIFIAGRQAKNGHMPNMVAFANLLDGIDSLSRKWKRPLKKIVHDRQSQFEGSLQEWHRLFSNASDEPIQRPGETVVFQKVPGSTFEVSASNDSAGIQLADLALWLFRQFLVGKRLPPASAAILQYVFRKGYQQNFSYKGVGEQVDAQYREMMEREISPEQEEAGRKLSRESEQRRLELISLYEEDGLMPYERNFMRELNPKE